MTTDRHFIPDAEEGLHTPKEDCVCNPDIESIMQFPGILVGRIITHIDIDAQRRSEEGQ